MPRLPSPLSHAVPISRPSVDLSSLRSGEQATNQAIAVFGHGARLTGDLANQIKGIATDVDARAAVARREELTAADSAFTAGIVDLEKQFDEDRNFNGRDDRFGTQSNALRQKIGQSIKDPEALADFNRMSDVDLSRASRRQSGLTRGYKNTHIIAKTNEVAVTSRREFLEAPDESARLGILRKVMSAYDHALASGAISEEEHREGKKNWTQVTSTARVNMMLPDEQIRVLQSKTGLSANIDPETRAIMLKKAMGIQELRIRKQLEDRNFELRNGVGVGADTKALKELIRKNILDPTNRDEALNHLDHSIRIGAMFNAVKGADQRQLNAIEQKLVEEFKKPGDGKEDYAAINAYQTAINQRNTALKKDSATYSMQTSGLVHDLYTQWASDQTPENFETYAQASRDEQIRLGRSPAEVRVLSAAAMENVASQMDGIADDPSWPQHTMLFLQNTAAQFGNAWPMVAKQLKEEKILNGATKVAASMSNWRAAEQLLVGSRIKLSELAKQADVTVKDVHDNVRSAIAHVIPQFTGIRGGEEELADLFEAISVLAIQNIKDRKSNPYTEAANDVFLKNYTFQPAYRIPNSPHIDVPRVINGAEALLKTVSLDNVVAPIDRTTNLSPEDSKKRYVLNIRDSAFWITNSDETGLELVDQHKRAVLERVNGEVRPITRTWGELSRPTERAGRGKFKIPKKIVPPGDIPGHRLK